MKFVSLTDRRIATTKGHVIIFEARKPLEVPAMIEDECIAAGLAPVGGRGDIEKLEQLARELDLPGANEVIPEPEPEIEPDVFDQAIFEAACREVIAKNDPADLTPKGQPKVSAVAALTGYNDLKALQITNFLKNLE